MGKTTVRIGGSGVQVTVRGGATQRVVLDRRTVAAIAKNQPKAVVRAAETPVTVTRQATVVNAGGGMGVQGPPGPAGGDGIATIVPGAGIEVDATDPRNPVVSAPSGGQGPKGDPGRDGQIRFSGHGVPGVIVGANPDDTYIDLDTGDIYKLT